MAMGLQNLVLVYLVQLSIVQHHDTIRALNCAVTVRHADPGDSQVRQHLQHSVFADWIKVCSSLVQNQYFGIRIQRSSQQDSLPLAGAQHATHVTDQAIVAHRHRGNL